MVISFPALCCVARLAYDIQMILQEMLVDRQYATVRFQASYDCYQVLRINTAQNSPGGGGDQDQNKI